MNFQDKVRRLFATIDAKDSAGFVSYLTDDAQFVFGNAPAVEGRDNIRAAVDGFFSSIKALSHRLDNIWEVPGHWVCTGVVTYTRRDDRTVAVPFCDVFQMEGELIKGYLIYIDVSPLFAA